MGIDPSISLLGSSLTELPKVVVVLVVGGVSVEVESDGVQNCVTEMFL